jgi:hypothetical protein
LFIVSPHIHMMVWLEGAPEFEPESAESHEEVVQFIDEFISCSSTDYPELTPFITYQRHKCTKTCHKGQNSKVCRFDAPFKPIDKTTILQPLTPEETEKIKKDEKLKSRLKNINTQIHEKLEEFSKDRDLRMTFEEFLEKHKIKRDEYILALRAKLKKTKILLKRAPHDCRINAFSPKILQAMKSNMDIQFALDWHAILSYINDYINKAQRGLSRKIQEACEEVKNGNFSAKQKLKTIANAFFNAFEMSAQEVSNRCLPY